MLSMIRLDDFRPDSEDPDELQWLLKGLVGQPFLFIRVSYGDELTVHLGNPVPYASPKLKGRRKGSYIVTARASSWILHVGLQPDQIYFSEDPTSLNEPARVHRLDMQLLEAADFIKRGSIVTQVLATPTPSAFLLTLRISGGSTLFVLPTTSTDGEVDESIADWEVFMPRHRILRAGPGLQWSYTDSRTPVEGSPSAQS